MNRLTRRVRTGVPAAILSLVVAGALAAPVSPRRSAEQRFMRHVAFLASDALQGRGNGTPELDQAADYLATAFASSGLRPAGDHGTFFQPLRFTVGSTLGPANALVIDGTPQRWGSDFVTLPPSASGAYDGGVVFAGYGLSAPELAWDDYAGIDVTGKAVVVFAHDLWERVPNVRPLGDMTSYEMKARTARRHGARAILFMIEPGHDPEEEDLTSLDTDYVLPHDLGILAQHVSRRSLEPLFEKAGTSVAAALEGIAGAMRPRSFALTGASIHVASDVRRTQKAIRNVVAALPGTDVSLRDEWLVIGAHYDHIGLGTGQAHTPGAATPHYGADDNASGTAGLLELARLFAQQRHTLKRSVMFVAFAGEELGLVGSSHFVDHSPVPLRSVRAMLNLDMIGRLSRGPLNVMGGSVPVDLSEWIRGANRDVGLTLAFSSGDFATSDWAAFRMMGVPALTFFTGMHDDYHRATDTVDKINAEGAMKVVTVVAGAARQIAGAGATVRPSSPPALRSSVGEGEPHIGVEMVFESALNAVRLDRVSTNSPAARAGLRAGDVLVEFGEQPIQTINDFRSALLGFQPGDMPAVIVERRGRRHRVLVTLGARWTTTTAAAAIHRLHHQRTPVAPLPASPRLH